MTNQEHAKRIRDFLKDVREGKPINAGGDVQAALEAGADALEGDNSRTGIEGRQQTAAERAAQQSDRDRSGAAGAALPGDRIGGVQPSAAPAASAAQRENLSTAGSFEAGADAPHGSQSSQKSRK